MTDTIKVYLTHLGKETEVPRGSTLMQVAEMHGPGFAPICARVDNKTEAMSYALYQPHEIAFVKASSASGQRVYTRSLCMMLYHAVTTLYPGARLRIEHSVSRGYFCRIEGTPAADNNALLAHMRALHAQKLPFVRHKARTGQVIGIMQDQGLDDKAALLQTVPALYTTYYTLGNVADSYYGCLAPNTGHIGVFDLQTYCEGFLLLGPSADNPAVPAVPIPQHKMFRAFTDYVDFNHILGTANVGQLNRAVEVRQAADLINVAEALHTKHISRISDEITRRYHAGGARIVLVAGPSSSGKTTTAKRLAVQLMTNLLRPVTISLDNYFVNRCDTPRDAGGDYDYESLYALDLKQFNADLNDLLAGKEVRLPSYSFELGIRQYKDRTVRLESGSVLLIEGIHGLNPELTAQVPEEMKFRVYVSALTTLSIDDHNWVPTTDNRLLRRIIRDYKYRGTSALETLRRWASVRAGEEKWIFPYQENADAMFNSSLIFELGVMRDYADAILSHVTRVHTEYATAHRLRKFLSYFRPIPAEYIPPTSLLREFLGGSSFHY